ncbi:hypothetical protein [Chitiniphilus shinanonensis]|uniref:Uncharacterized protein n=1 Tax=Chitiniphilus shinanonensis TaxID=553088 RepID=F8WST1_9NEIS|nr:hypothetical protein [Chitiniphilus shinanonensis]BAK53918.1 hypothetical protein [Chitiniphilus shinanonensis]
MKKTFIQEKIPLQRNSPRVNVEALWKQYEMEVALYRFHLEMSIKINAFHYAITGAILSFYFANKDIAEIEYSMVLPATFSAGLAITFLCLIPMTQISRKNIINLAKGLKIETPTRVIFLASIYLIFSLSNALIAIACIAISSGSFK